MDTASVPEGSSGTAILRRHSRRFWLVLGLALVLSFPGCLWGGRALRHRLARKRANHYAQAAADYIASGQIDAAIAQAQAALDVELANAAGQLQLARAYSAYANPRALIHWLNYFALTPNPGAQPCLEFARFNLQLGQPTLARQYLRQASLKETQSAAVLLALASLETNATTIESLLATAKRLAKSPGEKLAVAVTGYASPSGKTQLAGRAAIMELAAAGESGAQSFLLIQSGTNAAFAVAAFERSPTNRWLPEWQAVADFLAGRVKSPEPLVTRLRLEPSNLILANALANQGVNISTPELTTISREQVGLFFVQVDQLCAQQRWNELDRLVSEPRRKLPADLQAGLAAIASFGLGDTNTAHARMLLALAATQGSAPRVFGLARLAAEKGYAEFEAEAWMQLNEESELRDIGGQRLFELGQRFRRLNWIAAAAKKLAHDDPTTDWFGVWVYSRCLLQMNAAGVPEPTGGQTESALGRALRHAMLNQTDKALALIENTPNWTQSHPRFRLVSAFVYQRAGLRSELRRTLDGFGPEGLLPEELALLRQIQPRE